MALQKLDISALFCTLDDRKPSRMHYYEITSVSWHVQIKTVFHGYSLTEKTIEHNKRRFQKHVSTEFLHYLCHFLHFNDYVLFVSKLLLEFPQLYHVC